MQALAVVIFVLCSLGFMFADEQQEFMAKLSTRKEGCIVEANSDKDLVEKSFKGEFVEDEHLKCFWKCMYSSFDMISESGEVQVESMKEQIPNFMDKEKMLKIIDTCKDTDGADACDIAFKLAKCQMSEMTE